MTMLKHFSRVGLLLGAMAIALMAFAACDTDDPTPTQGAPGSGDNMMDDSTPDATMSGDSMSDDKMEDDDSMMSPDGEELSLVAGWYRGEQVRYYDFGMNSATNGSSVATAPIYVFIHGFNADGSPDFVEGQQNLVNVKPGDPGYSDLWQVMLVTVPEDYEPDSVRSVEDLMAMGYEITSTEMLVNCPIVEKGATLEGGESLTQGWYRGEEVYYPDFGANPANAIPIWVFATGVDADGNPQFVEGQHNIIDAVPGDPGYSAFWRVNLVIVDEAYEPDSVKSSADIQAMGYEVMQTDLVVNCPVVEYPGA